MEWIDVHVHLDKVSEKTGQSIHDLIQEARDHSVTKLITIGTEPADHPVVLDIARKYYPDVYCTLGVHPHEGNLYTDEVGEFILKHATEPVCVAVGEIGLDYYYHYSSREEQKRAFRQQLEIAKALKMPVEIHTRDAEEDTVSILKEFKGEVTGLIHCFTGTDYLAKEALDLGYNISLSGVLTFKNADSLRSIAKMIPFERLHVETDAPFLAPVPMRGKTCTPSYVVHTAKFLAELRGVDEARLAQQVKENIQKLFPKIQW